MKLSWLCFCDVQYNESEQNTPNILRATEERYASSAPLSQLKHVGFFIHVCFDREAWV